MTETSSIRGRTSIFSAAPAACALSKIPVTCVDRLNGRWGEPPRFASHL
jgi:hypothetical protein